MAIDDPAQLAAELREAFLTSGLTDAQRAELLAVAEVVPFTAGDVLFVETEPAVYLWMVLEGDIELSRRTTNEAVAFAVMSTPGQWAGGTRAWDGNTGTAGYLATGTAVTSGRVLRVPSDDLGRFVSEWSPFAKHFLNGIYQTIRSVETLARQRESLVALGTMAAGLAHEINNPAAASLRAVASLRTTCDTMLSSLMALAAQTISAEQYAALDALRLEAAAAVAPEGGALAAADREETIGAWLSERDVAGAWALAPVLATAGVDVDWCARVEAAVGSRALSPALQWAVSTLDARSLLDEMHDTTTRISQLVTAVKSYSQMDRALLQRTDVHECLDSTLVMLSHKLHDVTIERSFGEDVPQIDSYTGELNQVWANLIDNAVDAMDGAGTLRIATRVERPDLVVEVTDTGPGMSPEVLERAFQPFFTTKDVGKGTGLGLDISRRIVVERHNGEITFDSSPAGTTARVRIPLER